MFVLIGFYGALSCGVLMRFLQLPVYRILVDSLMRFLEDSFRVSNSYHKVTGWCVGTAHFWACRQGQGLEAFV